MIAIQRTKQLDTFHYISIPFCPFSPSISIFLLLNDHLSRLPHASSNCFCLHKSGNVVSNLLMLFIMFFMLVIEMRMTILVVRDFTVVAFMLVLQRFIS